MRNTINRVTVDAQRKITQDEVMIRNLKSDVYVEISTDDLIRYRRIFDRLKPGAESRDGRWYARTGIIPLDKEDELWENEPGEALKTARAKVIYFQNLIEAKLRKRSMKSASKKMMQIEPIQLLGAN